MKLIMLLPLILNDSVIKRYSIELGRQPMNYNINYQLRYLPTFSNDLDETVHYISNVLKNPSAADRLIDDIEIAIMERLKSPLSFEPYHSSKKRDCTYYKIKVRNYLVFYVVIDDVMEVRRLIYASRDIDAIL